MRAESDAQHREPARLKLAVRGAVQGVGFRPFVHRLAQELGLAGWVNNSSQGVFIEVEGSRAAVEEFLLRIETEKPPRSSIHSLESSWLDFRSYTGFEIRESESSGKKTALVLPDIATCPDCLREIFDPTNRRYRYPFTNCTNCGPRFSIIEALPYDRANTSMKSFRMCPSCQAEYEDPRDRRFHAQPNACPVCGPRLEFWNAAGAMLSQGHDGLLAAVEAIRSGQIVALKGIGGFHLMVDARNGEAVQRLRERKHREEKPLALMFPAIRSVKAICEVTALEARLLNSPEAPIVLLRRQAHPHPGLLPEERENRPRPFGKPVPADCSRDEARPRATNGCSLSPGERVRVRASGGSIHSDLAHSVAPGNPNLGVMLPSNPLHHLLMAELGFPVVATSGNLSDEPICTDEREALTRVGGIADAFLVHNRPIVRHVDDSIVRVILDREMVLRRARGYAPLPITLKSEIPNPQPEIVLAVGAHLKNTVALSVGDQVFISQHIGDLETEQANNAFRRVLADFEGLYEAKPEAIAADLHPDYLSTKFAQSVAQASPPGDPGGIPPVRSNSGRGRAGNSQAGSLRYIGVQHHIAHILSCMAENEVAPPALGVSWDGTGYGLDGTIWGGEFFLVTATTIERVAHLRPFRLPGGDAAVKEPRRAALGLLHALPERHDHLLLHLQQKVLALFSVAELTTVCSMLERGVNSPLCSSVGRLFDAVASLVGLRQQVRFEGQAAMELEFALDEIETQEAYELPVADRQSPVEHAADKAGEPTRNPQPAIHLLDWSPMIEAILKDVEQHLPVGVISAKFHNALVEAIVAVAKTVGEKRVVLSGGCFQNRYLTERTVTRLRSEGFQAYWHQRVPPNDGGIALGQVVGAMRPLTRGRLVQVQWCGGAGVAAARPGAETISQPPPNAA